MVVEPFRNDKLSLNLGKFGHLISHINVITSTLQEADVSIFLSLEAGDMLFLDTSHVFQPYGDTIYILTFLLPRLKSGVYVHIHDVFLPLDYPSLWMNEQRRQYTEQWALGAFLHGNTQWKTVLMSRALEDDGVELPGPPSASQNKEFRSSAFLKKV